MQDVAARTQDKAEAVCSESNIYLEMSKIGPCEREAKEKEPPHFPSSNLLQPPSDFQPAPAQVAMTLDNNCKVACIQGSMIWLLP